MKGETEYENRRSSLALTTRASGFYMFKKLHFALGRMQPKRLESVSSARFLEGQQGRSAYVLVDCFP